MAKQRQAEDFQAGFTWTCKRCGAGQFDGVERDEKNMSTCAECAEELQADWSAWVKKEN